jgi:hypothetical protein
MPLPGRKHPFFFLGGDVLYPTAGGGRFVFSSYHGKYFTRSFAEFYAEPLGNFDNLLFT